MSLIDMARELTAPKAVTPKASHSSGPATTSTTYKGKLVKVGDVVDGKRVVSIDDGIPTLARVEAEAKPAPKAGSVKPPAPPTPPDKIEAALKASVAATAGDPRAKATRPAPKAAKGKVYHWRKTRGLKPPCGKTSLYVTEDVARVTCPECRKAAVPATVAAKAAEPKRDPVTKKPAPAPKAEPPKKAATKPAPAPEPEDDKPLKIRTLYCAVGRCATDPKFDRASTFSWAHVASFVQHVKAHKDARPEAVFATDDGRLLEAVGEKAILRVLLLAGLKG